MTSPPTAIVIDCPGCGRRYPSWYRPSINLSLSPLTDEELERMTTSTCPTCGVKVQHRTLFARFKTAGYVMGYDLDGVRKDDPD